MNGDQELGDYEVLLATRDWQPIENYERQSGATVFFRAPGHYPTPGFFGERYFHHYADGSTDFDPLPIAPDAGPRRRFELEQLNRNRTGRPDTSPAFRKAQDCFDGQPLGFEPVEFAPIPDEWLERAIADISMPWRYDDSDTAVENVPLRRAG